MTRFDQALREAEAYEALGVAQEARNLRLWRFQQATHFPCHGAAPCYVCVGFIELADEIPYPFLDLRAPTRCEECTWNQHEAEAAAFDAYYP